VRYKIQHLEELSTRKLYQDRLDKKLGGRSRVTEEDWRQIKKRASEAAFETLGVQHRRKLKTLKIWNEELKQSVEKNKKKEKETYHK
jgi:hypothetical protein